MKNKKINYFDEFENNANYAVQSSEILYEFAQNFKYDNTLNVVQKVHTIEHTADRKVHSILKYLIKDFLPPIDRDDIIELVHRIDDVIDNIDEAVINLDILDVRHLREDFEPFVKLIIDGSNALKQMLSKFRNVHKLEEIQKLIIAVNSVEEEGDILFQNAIRNLYKAEKDPIEVSRWWIIYNSLENSLDSCEKVADCVEEIITKNS